MKSSYIIALVIAAAAAAWLASPYIVGAQNGAKPVEEGQPAVPAATVAEEQAPMRVQVRDSIAETRVNFLALTGQTEASRQATMEAETAGRVIAVKAEEGAAVKEGDILVELAIEDRQAQLDEARALVRQREIEFKAASQLSSKGFQTQTRLAETKANLEAAQARLRRIEIDIERTVIRAPFDGVVQSRVVEIGDYVGVGEPVALVIDLDPLLAVTQVSEREIAGVKRGQAGTVRLITGDVVDGRVRYISSVASEGTRTFRVELEIDNGDGRLAAGLTSEVRVPVASVSAHNISPAALTLDDKGLIGVKIVDEKNIVRFQPVELVSDGPGGVWLGGLPERVSIITVGQEFVLPGQKVIPVTAADTSGPTVPVRGNSS